MRLPSHLLLLLPLAAACPRGASGPEHPAPTSDGPGEAPADRGLAAALDDAVVGVANEELASVLRAHWQWRLERSPVHATELGVHDYDDRLAAIGPEAEESDRATRRELLERARSIDPSGLSSADSISWRLFVESMERDIASEVCVYSQWNLSARSNPVTEMNRLPQAHRVANRADADNLVTRYRALAGRIDGRIENLRRGAKQNLYANAESTRRVVAMARTQLGEATEQWPILSPATTEPGWTEADRVAFGEEVSNIIESELRPALQRWVDFLEKEIAPAARDEAHTGLAALPVGADCYQAMVRSYTTMDLTPEQIHETGLREMKRINDEMRALGKKLFGTKNLAKTLERLRTDPELYFDSEQGVEEFAAASLAAAKAKMPEYFGIVPQADCVVTRVPAYEAPFTTIAYYEPPFPDGSKPGEYYINTTAPTTRPRYEARVLAHHEAIPGHHLQIAIAQELPEVPAFRRHGGRTVFVEGWALYTERLSDEMGLYPEDLDRMGVLSFDAWRAGRLVVDTGIHAKGWSRQQAIDYLVEHSALAPNNIDNEVDRYISWPGQAVAYKLGQLEILELRARAEKAMGEGFDIKAFHDVVLGAGAVSIEILRERVEAWIAEGKSG